MIEIIDELSTLLYRGFLMNEAKGNQSDCV